MNLFNLLLGKLRAAADVNVSVSVRTLAIIGGVIIAAVVLIKVL